MISLGLDIGLRSGDETAQDHKTDTSVIKESKIMLHSYHLGPLPLERS